MLATRRATVTKPLAEALYAAPGVENLLLAGIKRVARRANLKVNVLCQGGARGDHVATATGSIDLVIFGMNLWFHLAVSRLAVRHIKAWPPPLRKGRAV